MSETPIIQTRQLTKTHRVGDIDVHALRGVNLEVNKGEFISVVGASGSGKSTHFNVLGGLTPAQRKRSHQRQRPIPHDER
jgi:putative ABC transport system ATP-binding protein